MEKLRSVEAFGDSEKWIRHDLWVETEFDTDGDGKMDRMHVAVTRPYQTDTDRFESLPVVYISSPYFAGVAPDVEGGFWDVVARAWRTCTTGIGFMPRSQEQVRTSHYFKFAYENMDS